MRPGTIGATALLLAGMAATPTLAQTASMDHDQQMGSDGSMAMDHDMSGMDHDMAAMGEMAMDRGAMSGMAAAPVSEPGQGAFAAIAEIVARLAADPQTDWASVDIDALRAHLVDMDLVTTRASAASTPIEGGLRFTVTGSGDVVGAVQRMVLAHAAIMNGVDGWQMSAKLRPQGAVLEIRVPEADSAKLAGLGFFGVLALGMHHQAHHWMMATGQDPHM